MIFRFAELNINNYHIASRNHLTMSVAEQCSNKKNATISRRRNNLTTKQ